jgi:hypothetical protein
MDKVKNTWSKTSTTPMSSSRAQATFYPSLEIHLNYSTKTRLSFALFNKNYAGLSQWPDARSKASVCSRSPAEIVGSNPPKGMDILL